MIQQINDYAKQNESRRDVKAEEVINNAQVPDDSDKFYVLAEQITILKTKLQNNEKAQIANNINNIIGV